MSRFLVFIRFLELDSNFRIFALLRKLAKPTSESGTALPHAIHTHRAQWHSQHEQARCKSTAPLRSKVPHPVVTLASSVTSLSKNSMDSSASQQQAHTRVAGCEAGVHVSSGLHRCTRRSKRGAQRATSS